MKGRCLAVWPTSSRWSPTSSACAGHDGHAVGGAEMCGRLVRDEHFDPAQLGFAGFSETAFAPRYNIAPTQLDLLGRVEDDGHRRLMPSFWGLIPSWAKERAIGGKLFNARAETLTERPA
ncbi:MAG: hypothetical protein C4290_09685, partial [Chloroflexota bacterium]